MAGMLGGSQSIVSKEERIGAMRVQTSAYGMTVAWMRGRTRLAGNLMWYDDFRAIEHRESQSSGKGGGVKSTSITYTYEAAVIIGLCGGVAQSIGTVWRDKEVFTSLSQLGFVFFNGAQGQSPWAYLTSKHPSEAIGYSGQVYVAAGPYSMGNSPTLGNHSFEVYGPLSDATMDGDANPKDIAVDFLTGDEGVGFPASLLGDWTSYSNWCRASGLFVSPAIMEQTEAHTLLESLVESTHADWLWSDGKLKILPRGDQAITANGATYTPSMPVIYDLTDDDFFPSPGEPPVKLRRRTTADAYNYVDVQFFDREKDYNTNTVSARDQAAIRTHGLRPATVLKTHAQRASVAQIMADLRLRRLLNIRNEYEFTLAWNKIGLEPGDIVRVTDSYLGMDEVPVRILEIKESEDGDLDVLAEEWPFEVSSYVVYPTDPNAGYSPNYNAQAPDTNTPVIFEPPTRLSGDPAVLIAASGGTGWGGCGVHVSLDGVSYQQAGVISSKAIHGTLTATLPSSGVTPDVTNTLSVSLAVSGGSLSGGSTVDADSWVTLCYVDGEFLAYRDATLTGANAYDLDYLVRGAYGSQIGAHSASTKFVRIDDAVFRLEFPVEWVAKTVYIKLPSFNEFGGGRQTLADATAHTYTIQGESLPSITGLMLAEPWTGPDVSIKWNVTQSARSYTVEVYDGVTLRRTVSNIADPRYTYTFASNLEDGLKRTVTFKVSAESATGQLSAPTSLAAGNPQIGTPTGLVLVPGMGSFTVGTAKPADEDYAGTKIWSSQTSGYTPDGTTLVYDGPDTGAPVIDQAGGIPVYVRVAHYDKFGDDSLNLSSEISTTPFAVGGGIEVVSTLPIVGNTEGRVVYLTTDEKLHRYDGTEWITWVDGSDILASSVTAGKINVTALSAISATMGTITSGNLTIDASGFVRGGATTYGSGAGFWMGYQTGDYVFRVGSDSNRIQWDGDKAVMGDPSGARVESDSGVLTIYGLGGNTITMDAAGITLAAAGGSHIDISATELGIYATAGTSQPLLRSGSGVSADWGALTNKPSDSQLFNNLLDPSTWVTGHDGVTGFTRNGGIYEQYRFSGALPDGSTGLVWRCLPGYYYNNAEGEGTLAGGTPPGDADGGWETTTFAVDSLRPYRFAVWAVRDAGTAGFVYFGCQPNSVQDMASGGVNGNPYFYVGNIAGALPVAGRWYLIVGYVWPSHDAAAAQTGKGGVYDSVTGEKTLTGTDFCWMAAQTATYHRAYLHYSATGARVSFVWPRVDQINGNEPSLGQLLSMGAVSGRNKINASNVSTFIDSLAVNTAQIANAAITNAKIGALAVDTLNIAGNAVTIPVSASGSTSATTATTNFDSSSVMIIATGQASLPPGAGGVSSYATLHMTVKESGSVIGSAASTQFSGTSGPNVAANLAWSGRRTGVTSKNYSVELSYSGSCGIVAIGTKK